ncbi:hypothetical protein J6590_072080 [Homalodisca vitripennis]|nr:hypothetical protein J6590_072080 [Homalodisca vitripennis]
MMPAVTLSMMQDNHNLDGRIKKVRRVEYDFELERLSWCVFQAQPEECRHHKHLTEVKVLEGSVNLSKMLVPLQPRLTDLLQRGGTPQQSRDLFPNCSPYLHGGGRGVLPWNDPGLSADRPYPGSVMWFFTRHRSDADTQEAATMRGTPSPAELQDIIVTVRNMVQGKYRFTSHYLR